MFYMIRSIQIVGIYEKLKKDKKKKKVMKRRYMG